MSNTSTALELEVMPPEVAAVSTELSAPKETALSAFTPFQKLFAESAALLAREKEAVTTAQARELRLAMKRHRVTSKNTKDTVKADILLAGRLADAYFNRIAGPLENAEARLDEIEKAEERAEAARKQALKEKRTAELAAASVDGQFFPLGEMPDEAYAQLLASSKLAHETKLAAAAKAEVDRIEAERVAEIARLKKIEDDRIERERIQAENARLEKEATEARQKEIAEAERLAKIEREKAAAALAAAEEAARVDRERVAKEKAAAEKLAAEKLAAQEAQAKKEREAIEAKAKAEREAAAEVARVEREKREALEKAERERISAEKKRQQDEADALARAAAAPDKEKLLAFASLIETLEIPEMATAKGKDAVQSAIETIEQLVISIRTQASKL